MASESTEEKLRDERLRANAAEARVAVLLREKDKVEFELSLVKKGFADEMEVLRAEALYLKAQAKKFSDSYSHAMDLVQVQTIKVADLERQLAPS
ncbi:MAG: hypothetical protein Hyperionvirus6_50 [Hyperionvirus sp.]|uniref:Uncharacterized protein n=1 Tax=Hyperionvirus sp. TaxID=2487770 RepID=A0A3G5ADC8_9VIRU|nr:MAG: hypothetical protein Hyperionvirus6_50 [Hyperionvirus sp.]